MFKTILVEEEVRHNERTRFILNKFPNSRVKTIGRIDDYFGVVKKPYLQKRTNLNLYVGKKRGQLIKQAPDAYGTPHDPHFYFIHTYNCPYECEYCYLQGYFHSPDIVFFVNHEDIGKQIKSISKKYQTPWFHGGEFSDSLVFSHITQEIPFYFELFKKIPHARLELRTKSSNIRPLLNRSPLSNVIISYSLSPEEYAKMYDYKTPSVDSRLKSIKILNSLGHPIGIHFDPIIHHDDFVEQYRDLLLRLLKVLPSNKLTYLSLGVVRFTKTSWYQVGKNYPKSRLLAENFHKGDDGKIRSVFTKKILKTIKDLCLDNGIPEKKIYLCMEV